MQSMKQIGGSGKSRYQDKMVFPKIFSDDMETIGNDYVSVGAHLVSSPAQNKLKANSSLSMDKKRGSTQPKSQLLGSAAVSHKYTKSFAEPSPTLRAENPMGTFSSSRISFQEFAQKAPDQLVYKKQTSLLKESATPAPRAISEM